MTCKMTNYSLFVQYVTFRQKMNITLDAKYFKQNFDQKKKNLETKQKLLHFIN